MREMRFCQKNVSCDEGGGGGKGTNSILHFKAPLVFPKREIYIKKSPTSFSTTYNNGKMA